MPDLYADFVFGAVAATINNGDTTATLDDVTSFPSNTLLAKGDFYVTFDAPLTHPAGFETVKVTNVNTSTKVITFTPASTGHAIGTAVKGTLTAGMIQRIRAGLSGTAVPAQDNTIYTVGDQFLLTTNNQLYVYTSTGFVPSAAANTMNYRGAWSNSTTYALNDVVTAGSKAYICTSAQPALLTASFVGAATKNSIVSTGTITLPAGTQKGDLAVLAIGAEAALGTNTGFTVIGTQSGPSGTLTQISYRTLTQSDITAGLINTTVTSAFGAMVLYVLRNASAAPSIQSGSATTATVAAFTPAATGLALVFFRGLAAATSASATGGYTNLSFVAGTGNNDVTIVASAACTVSVATAASTGSTSPSMNAGFLSSGGLAFPFSAPTLPSTIYFAEIAAFHDVNGRMQVEDASAATDVVNVEYMQANALLPVVKNRSFSGTAAAAANTFYYYTCSSSMTLPTAVGNSSVYMIACQSTTGVTINTTSGQTINSLNPYTLNNFGSAVMIVADGSGFWRIVAQAINNSTVVAKSTAYTVTLADLFNRNTLAVTGTTTITLPDATPATIGAEGHAVTIKNTGTAVVSVTGTSGQTIDGLTTYPLNVPGSSITVQSDGANFQVIAATGLNSSIVAKTSAYTASATDLLLDNTITVTGTTTITLPTSVGRFGKTITIKNLDATLTTTIATTSSQTIDGSTTKTLTTQYSAVTLQSDGANWLITAKV